MKLPTHSNRVLTLMLLPITWSIMTHGFPTTQGTGQTNSRYTSTPSSVRTVNSNSNIGLSNSSGLQLILAAYSSNHSHQANPMSSAPTRMPMNIQPALLDYENATAVENLERTVTNQTDTPTEIELPSDVYEVPLEVWITEEGDSESAAVEREDEPIDETQRIIVEALQTESSAQTDHTIRHRGRRVATRNANNRQVSEDSVASLPLETANINRDIYTLLQQQQQTSEESNGSLDLLRQRERFNMTVDYQAPFQNIESNQLMEIVTIMNSDCTQVLRKKKLVRWVSGTRGILFECRNGAWVVTYLSRRTRKLRPTSVRDCHEIHLQELNLNNPELPHHLVIHYNNGERKTMEVKCKHDDRHTNHELIDNHINADPNLPVQPVRQTVSGAWTVIQRRESGDTKFYRSMKRYKRGFGSVEGGEYWLGLEALHEVTHERPYMLRVEVTTNDNSTYYSEYDRFRVGSEAKGYRLRLGAFIEPANNTMSSGDFLTLHHGGRFHTRDSDKFPVNCARLYGTAFWFRGCWAAVNLNGPYITSDSDNSGVRWATANPNEVRRVWKTEMMIKPIL